MHGLPFVNWHSQVYPGKLTDHISGAVTYNMVILLQIKTTTFKKTENLKKTIQIAAVF